MRQRILSARVPDDYRPNPIAMLLEEKRRAGRRVLDLTVTNPTKVGLPTFPWNVSAEPGDARIRSYDPEPRGSLEARRAIADILTGRGKSAFPVDPSRLFLTASTSEGYAHLFRLLCDAGDEVLVPRPSYPLLEPLAHLEHVTLGRYALHFDGRWRLDVDSVAAAVGPRTRAIVAVQPNNPTGSCFDRGEAEAVEAICESRGLSLISDEVFGESPWPPRVEPLPSFLGERRVPTFVLNGISKLCGLPQMKVAWIALAGPQDLVARAGEGLEWIADLFLSVGAPAEAALSGILQNRGGFQSAVRERMETNLELLRGTGSRSGTYTLLEADGGWSAVLRLGPESGRVRNERHDDLAEWALDRHDVLLHPGHYYELEDQDVVLSLLVEPAVLEDGLTRLGLR